MEGGIRKKRHKKHHTEELNIIPLIDITANLLFFLMVGMDLKEKAEAGEKVELPVSSSKSQEEVSMVRVAVTKEELLLEGVKQASLEGGKIARSDINKDGFLGKLRAELEKKRKAIEASGLDMTLEKNKPVVFMLADRSLEYDTVELVMRTAGSAGFPRFRFGVLSK
ncbi:MAG: biopolymer transporter ExbD [Deltaproteobacteria bacterium]|nr:biopolymer transporter ExbD [Deltaproteobacteria bacterium]